MAHLRKLKVFNFKSLHGPSVEDSFSIDFEKFTCLVGLNGSGKTTILQFLDFVGHVMRGDVAVWLEERGWQAGELNYAGYAKKEYNKVKNITATLVFQKNGDSFRWEFVFNRDLGRCTMEEMWCNGETIFQVKSGEYHLSGKQFGIDFVYSGSILSSLKPPKSPGADKLAILNEAILSITSLELLSPHALRMRTRGKPDSMGISGKNITAYFAKLPKVQQDGVRLMLGKYYPNLVAMASLAKKAGWKEIYILEEYGDTTILSESRHINDGLLRLLAIVTALVAQKDGMLILDEIENGINPELVNQLIDMLVSADKQVLVTTHSPLVLNFLDDEVARKSVQLVYKTERGYTRAVPLFGIPELEKRLDVMGPGEALLDTDMLSIADRLAREG